MISSELVICWIYDVFVDTHTHVDLVVLALVLVTTDAFFDAFFFQKWSLQVLVFVFRFIIHMMETNIAGGKRKTNNK
jgi:hypothetical protein